MKANKPFEKFLWKLEWLKYAASMPRDDEQAFNWAVIRYGLCVAEPTELRGEALAYFNSEIRPDIDRQHKRMREGKAI